MPNIKAAQKWMRQSETRTTRNKDTKSRLKTIFKKAVTTRDSDAAKSVESELDKAAKCGIIHPNKAARKKSRLAKELTRVVAAPQKESKTKRAATPKKSTKK